MSSQNTQHIESIAVNPDMTSHSSDAGFLTPDVMMVVFTWVTFFLLLAILQKFAWKPILANLDKREESIRESLENADKIASQMAEIQATHNKMLEEAELESKAIIEKSRKAAVEAAKIIENKAREESKILLENAQRDIKAEIANARENLRKESSRIAIELAGKLIEENLDTEKNHQLINRIMKEL